MNEGAVDSLLWISSFRVDDVPRFPGPRIVLGAPALAERLGDPTNTVFIPVATPGLGTAGHLFRADGVVMLPLHAVIDQGLPPLGDVIRQIHQGLGAEGELA